MKYKMSQYNSIVPLIGSDGEFLLYNYNSNGLIKINKDYKNKFEKESLNIDSEFSDTEKEMLYNNGLLIDKKINELHKIILEHNLTYMHSSLFKMTILPTLECNFKCPYCFENTGKNNVFMSSEVIDKTIEFIESRFKKNPMLKILNLDLYGGEPLVGMKQLKEFFDKLAKIQKQLKFQVETNITTNGFLLNKSNINLLKEFNCTHAMISIDGYKETHNKTRMHKSNDITDTYSVIIGNCKEFVSAGNTITLRFHLTSESTKNEIENVLNEFEHDLRARIFPIFVPIFSKKNIINKETVVISELRNMAMEMGYNISNALEEISQKRSSCNTSASIDSYTITPNGNIFICDYSNFSEVDFDKYGIGNIREYDKVFENTNYINFTGDFFYQKINCRNCKFLPACKGGCKVKSYQKTNADGSAVCPLAIMREKNEYLLINDLYLQQKSLNREKK